MRFRLAAVALSLGLLFTLPAPVVQAQDASADQLDAHLRKRIAIVDMQALFRDSAAGKSIQKQLESQQATYKASMDKQGKALKTAEEQLTRQRTVLSPEAYAAKREEFQNQLAAAQRDLQSQKRTLDVAFGQALEKVQGQVVKIITSIAETDRLMLVLPRQQVVLAQNNLDITPKVLEQLNKALPSVKVDMAAASKAAAQSADAAAQ